MAPRKRLGIVALVAALSTICLAVVVWVQAQRSLKNADEQALEGALLPITIKSLSATPPVFQPILAESDYTSAVIFKGDLWLSGSGGLYRTDISTGELISQWRPGAELPAAAITALAVGRVGAASEARLLAATAGEGVLSISSNGEILQIRPEQQKFADLTALLPLSTGGILLGTQQTGLLFWDGQHVRRYHELLSDQQVTALAGSEGDLWIGTLSHGLQHWAGGALTQFGEAEGLPDRRILSIAYEPGRVFSGTPLGVASFRDGRFDRSFAEGVFAAALHKSPDSLLIGTLDEGAIEIPLAEQRTPRPPGPRESIAGPNDVRAFVVDGPAIYVVARSAAYVKSADDPTWKILTSSRTNGLRDRNISALHVDSSGRLWVGYFDRGFDVLDASYERVTQVENDRIFCVNRIKASPDDQAIAVATANGLAYFDQAVRMQQFLTQEDGLIASHVTDLAFTTAATVLATSAGLTFFDAGGVHSLNAFHGLVNNHVYSLGATGNEILAGTLGGLSRLRGSQLADSFTTANSPLSHNWVSAISYLAGDWFIGLYGGGVVRLSSNDKWISYPELKNIEINPNAMTTSGSHLYAGTLDQGLLVYDPREDSWQFITEGLPSKNITALAWANDTLYVGSDNGLSHAHDAELIGR